MSFAPASDRELDVRCGQQLEKLCVVVPHSDIIAQSSPRGAGPALESAAVLDPVAHLWTLEEGDAHRRGESA